jgi:hypothetical protein
MSRRKLAPPPEPGKSRLWKPQTLRPFTGGPLEGVAYELDDGYYGAAHANRQADLGWLLDWFFAYFRQIGVWRYGPVSPTPEEDMAALERPRPRPLPSSFWIQWLHQLDRLWALSNWEEGELAPSGNGGMEPVSSFRFEEPAVWRLDVYRAVSTLDAFDRKLFQLYRDGWKQSEIADHIRFNPQTQERMTSRSVGRHLREINRQLRREMALSWPPPKAPLAHPIPTTVISQVLEELGPADPRRNDRRLQPWRRPKRRKVVERDE